MLLTIIPFEPTLISIVKGLLFLNPTSFLLIGGMFLLWLTLKTVTAKLAFLGVSLLLSAIIGYCIYRSDKKQSKVEKKKIDFVDSFFDTSSATKKEEEKELMLTRIFKK